VANTGTRPKRRLVTIETTRVKARTRRSGITRRFKGVARDETNKEPSSNRPERDGTRHEDNRILQQVLAGQSESAA